MKIIKKIKRFLGLELPHLLEEEEEAKIEIKENILKAPEGFYKNENWIETIKQLNQAMMASSITTNQAREMLNLRKVEKRKVEN
ncbi:MAG: hypothetical protein OSJ66_07295 [Clostridia bacterium]|nr:hypothetical protein [Clostridia bacterium]